MYQQQYNEQFTAATRQFAVLESDQTGATTVNITSLTDVIQRNPNDAAAYVTRGAAYARAGQFNDAIGDFTKAVQIDPNSASAYNNRALANRQIGRNDAALQDFSKSISADPNYAPAYIGRANVLRAQGDLEGAEHALDQDLHAPATGLGAEQPRRQHAGVVEHQQVGALAAGLLRGELQGTVTCASGLGGEPDDDRRARRPGAAPRSGADPLPDPPPCPVPASACSLTWPMTPPCAA